MDSIGTEEDSSKTADSDSKAKVKAEELQHALNVLAKYGIIHDPKFIQERTGFKIGTHIIAKVRGEDGQIKKTYEFENGKLMEGKNK